MDKDKLITLEGQLKDFYRNFHAQCDLIDTYYNLKFPIPNIEGFTEYRPSTAQVAIDDAAAQIDISSLQVRVPYRSESKKTEATKLEMFLNGCWYAVLRNDGTLLNRKSKSLFKDGVGIFKILCDTDAEPVDKEEGYRFDKFPFLVLLKHPTHVMVDPSYFSTGNFRYVIESYKRKAGDIREAYNSDETTDTSKRYAWKSDKDINTDVDWIEYWDDTNYIKIADKDVVEEGEHDYGSPPYEITDAGLGYEDKDGLPECRWRSLLHASLFDLTLEARLLYQCEAILRINAWPQDRYQVTDTTGAMDEKRAQEWVAGLPTSPMAKIVIPAGLTPIEAKAVVIPPPIFNVLGMVQSKIDSATVAKVARGERPEGAASGYMTAILAGMARIKFGPAMNSLQRTIERINRRFLRFVEVYYPDEGIAVWGKLDTEPFDITLKAKDIKGYYINEVNLSSIAPEEESRRMSDGIQVYSAGLCSAEYAKRHYLMMKNPQADQTQMLVEQIINSPELKQKLAMSLMGSPEFMGQVTSGLVEAGMPMPNLGNQGNPPPPSQSGPTPTTVMNQTPIQAGSPEENTLVAKQNQGLNQKLLTGRI
jgi:hypothetical protein